MPHAQEKRRGTAMFFCELGSLGKVCVVISSMHQSSLYFVEFGQACR